MKNYYSGMNEGFLLSPFFDDFFSLPTLKEEAPTRVLDMKTDIKEEDKEYKMLIDLPGVDKKDITVSLENGYLVVKAKVNYESEEKEKKTNYLHRERFSGAGSRSFYVGDIDEKSISAEYVDGVLALVIPKQDKKEIENKHVILIK